VAVVTVVHFYEKLSSKCSVNLTHFLLHFCKISVWMTLFHR
jgi:hypothetical protein